MKSICNLFNLILTLTLVACVKNDPELIQNPPTQITFTVEESSAFQTFKSQVKHSSLVNKSTGVHRHFQKDSVYIFREKTFNLFLQNNDTISMTMRFQKYESVKWLNFIDDQKWTYKSLEDEKLLFYNKFDEVRLDFGSHALVYSKPNENFKIEKVLKVEEQGVEKNYIEISFSGTTYPWYGSLPVYTISGGFFKGVLE